MCRNSGPSGEALLAVATLVSLQMAQGRTSDQLELLAAFFEVLGDNLGLIAAARPSDSGSCDSRLPQCGSTATQNCNGCHGRPSS